MLALYVASSIVGPALCGMVSAVLLSVTWLHHPQIIRLPPSSLQDRERHAASGHLSMLLTHHLGLVPQWAACLLP